MYINLYRVRTGFISSYYEAAGQTLTEVFNDLLVCCYDAQPAGLRLYHNAWLIKVK
jgi:hypothetical protein